MKKANYIIITIAAITIIFFAFVKVGNENTGITISEATLVLNKQEYNVKICFEDGVDTCLGAYLPLKIYFSRLENDAFSQTKTKNKSTGRIVSPYLSEIDFSFQAPPWTNRNGQTILIQYPSISGYFEPFFFFALHRIPSVAPPIDVADQMLSFDEVAFSRFSENKNSIILITRRTGEEGVTNEDRMKLVGEIERLFGRTK